MIALLSFALKALNERVLDLDRGFQHGLALWLQADREDSVGAHRGLTGALPIAKVALGLSWMLGSILAKVRVDASHCETFEPD